MGFFISSQLQQKLLFIRIFAYLSALGALLVAGITLLLVITHFTLRVHSSLNMFMTHV
jgi:hypothetical protein